MKKLVHLSDLHFGRDRPELMQPLTDRINALGPDMVAISGDLTQRARSAQFQQARRFIDSLDAPVLSVPGNHDTPLYNLMERVLRPFAKYRRFIDRDLQPVHHTAQATVLGINSVNPWGLQRGWFTRRDIRRARRGFAKSAPGALRIVVVHHPLEHLPGERKKLTRGARSAIRALGEVGCDIVLSGHLHSWRAGTFALTDAHRAVLQVHAGTGLSNRLRGEPNDFNLLHLTRDHVRVDRYAVPEDAAAFSCLESAGFRRGDGGWQAVPTDTCPPDA